MRILGTAVALFALLLLISCGSGSTSSAGAPVFLSVAGTAASEGSAYTYQVNVVDPAEKSVTLSLTSGPTGAALSGNTITWTPTPAQSRVANSFMLSAASAGGTSTQSWSVTPSGTVHVSRVNTYWTPNGLQTVTPAWPSQASGGVASGPFAMVAQADGGYLVLPGFAAADGTYTIPEVPGGYYWLVDGPVFGGTNYWTSSSTVDLGGNTANGTAAGSTGIGLFPLNGSTTFDLSFSGLDPIQNGTFLGVYSDYPSPFTPLLIAPICLCTINGNLPPVYQGGGTTYSWIDISSPFGSQTDFTKISNVLVGEYDPVSLGSSNAAALGPILQIQNPSWTNSGTNSIAGTLSDQSQVSVDVNIKGSAWGTIADNVAPVSVQLAASNFGLAVQPLLTKQSAVTNNSGVGFLPLVESSPSLSTGIVFASLGLGPSGGNCGSLMTEMPESVLSVPLITASYGTLAPMTADQDIGVVQYSDPFPADWPRIFSFCQLAVYQLANPVAPATSWSVFVVAFGGDSAIPTAPVSPTVGPVQSPTINGDSLFVAKTITTSYATLSWTAPKIGAPYGYQIQTHAASSSGAFIIRFGGGELPTYYTAKTSATIPLSPGQTYFIEITALVDGASNVETSPNRTALPRGYATVFSAPITVSPSARAIMIKGETDKF